MAKILYILQGVPGSGKSTVAEMICHDHDNRVDRDGGRACIHSTDNFWYKDTPGVYSFDKAMLGEAHRWNQRNVAASMVKGIECIVVDNTNITKPAAQPYFVLADMYGYEVQVVRVQVAFSVAAKRQEDRPEDRRVPVEVIRNMFENMESLI